jgi:hypothetical protein
MSEEKDNSAQNTIQIAASGFWLQEKLIWQHLSFPFYLPLHSKNKKKTI